MKDAVQALLLIDIQEGLDAPHLGRRNNPGAEQNAATLLREFRHRQLPVLHVKHNSTEPRSTLRPGLPGNRIKPMVAPLANEPLFEKDVNSAFIGTGLQDYLNDQQISQLVVAGLTTDHCVSTSVRMAGNLGFTVLLIADACATFDRTGPDGTRYTAEQMHGAHLASLDGEFCEVIDTSRALSMLARFPSANNEHG